MLRLGIVDFDSSHSLEFTRRFNQVGVSADQWVTGARVVAGWPGTSTIAPERIDLFCPQVAACGVEIVGQIEDLLGRVDAVLVLSLSGAAHLERAAWLLEHRMPLFIDKPLAGTLQQARELQRLAEAAGVLVWQASGMRFSDDVLALRSREAVLGPIFGLVSHGPGWLHAGNPGLLHYGVHTVEQAYAVLGPGCAEVACRAGERSDTLTAVWADGRQATIRTLREGFTAYGLLTFHRHGVVHTPVSTRNSYRNLCRQIVESFTTGVAPVPLEESVEVMQFIDAAARSQQSEGVPVSLSNAP